MFIFNIKLNHNSLKRLLILSLIIILIIVFVAVGFRFYKNISKVTVSDNTSCIEPDNYININSSNYTDILDDCHKNIDKYVGKKIKFTGFVYRLYDFNENQFVLAREMVISSNNEAVIVGFLCNNSIKNLNLSTFPDYSWVEIEGTITKGNYHGDIPIIELTSLTKTTVPADELVYPPNDTYINTET